MDQKEAQWRDKVTKIIWNHQIKVSYDEKALLFGVFGSCRWQKLGNNRAY